MKKYLAIAITAGMILSLTACGSSDSGNMAASNGTQSSNSETAAAGSAASTRPAPKAGRPPGPHRVPEPGAEPCSGRGWSGPGGPACPEESLLPKSAPETAPNTSAGRPRRPDCSGQFR